MWELILRVLASRGSVYSTGSRKTCSLTNNEQKKLLLSSKPWLTFVKQKMHVPQVPLKLEVTPSVPRAHVTRIDVRSIELVVSHVDPVDGRVHALRLNARETKLVDAPNNHEQIWEAENIDGKTLHVTRVFLQSKIDSGSGMWDHGCRKKIKTDLKVAIVFNHPLQRIYPPNLATSR